jgi:hypothetical protein
VISCFLALQFTSLPSSCQIEQVFNMIYCHVYSLGDGNCGSNYRQIRCYPSLLSLTSPAMSRATFHGNHRHYVMILTVCVKMSSSNLVDVEMQGPDSSGNKLSTAVGSKGAFDGTRRIPSFSNLLTTLRYFTTAVISQGRPSSQPARRTASIKESGSMAQSTNRRIDNPFAVGKSLQPFPYTWQ